MGYNKKFVLLSATLFTITTVMLLIFTMYGIQPKFQSVISLIIYNYYFNYVIGLCNV